MERRDLLKLIALATGSVLIGGELFLTGCKNDPAIGGEAFSADDISFLDEAGETIIPTTKSPGAKATEIGKFMTVMVNDCYDADDQKTFHKGIGELNDASKKMFKTSFMEATPAQRTQLLTSLDKDALDYQKKRNEFDKGENAKLDAAKGKGASYDKKKMSPHYFTMLKQLSMLGYFTSKIGSTEALRMVPGGVPGRYDGDMPYKKGDRGWNE